MPDVGGELKRRSRCSRRSIAVDPASFPSQVRLTVAYGQASVVTYQYLAVERVRGLSVVREPLPGTARSSRRAGQRARPRGGRW